MKRDRLAHDSVQSNEKSARRKADDASASSSSAASTGSDNYDVFLSFSGQDTRKTIADHLYNGLFDASIRVFRDNNELREGEKIGTNLLQAIKNSKISIPILSQNYASSKWCLQELIEMIECIKSRHVVLPIFYHVEPTDVRNQTRSFGEAFSCLSRKYPEDVEKWKVALQEVASMKGWESEKTADNREGDLVKMVVRKVLSELKNAFQLDVTEHLVGIDNAVESILRLLDDNPSAIQIVGIYGMGGIGKTTLAKVVHNKLSNQFQYRSFIADIRESSQRNGIFNLQNQLIRDLKEKDQASNKDEGISLLGSRFKRKKVLILLDDVDDIEQIRALIGKYDWFEMGSRIIITTRSKFVLDDVGINCKYKLEEIPSDKSLTLFSRHAFRTDFPPCGFESLSRDVTSFTGGLPLALEVIGSFLCGKRHAFWQNALKKLQKVPHKKVREKLMISYDALDNEEKQIFFVITCFLIGGDLRYASYMWDACTFFPNMGIETLSFMSLIKIGDDGKVQMHDQLRDLGRDIVRQEDYNVPMNRSRLWLGEEALEVLERNKGIQKDSIHALCLEEDWRKGKLFVPRSESDGEFTTERFETLPYLRFLAMGGAKLIGDSRNLLHNLRWLMWRCPTCAATSFSLEGLVILDLSKSSISESWKGWSHLKMAKHLKVLDLRDCGRLGVTPDLSAFRNLEIIKLKRCWYLKQIHPSIGAAKGLLYLNLQGCSQLQELPQEMGKLEKLEELYIGETAIGKIPQCISSLKTLKVLDAAGCESLFELSDSISHLVNLLTLDLRDCPELCKLPESIGSLVKLQRLSFGPRDKRDWSQAYPKLNRPYEGICELPKSIGDLKILKILQISCCIELSNLPSTISKLGNLEELDASHCKSLEGKIHIDGLSSLKILQLSSTGVSGFHGTFNKMLQSLPELPTSLTVLKVSGRHSTFPQLSHLIHLKKLTVKDCPLLKSMPELPSRLLKLSVSNCGELKELPSLSRLELLSKLYLNSCRELTEIRGLEGLKSLATLIVPECSKLSNLDGLEHLESLRLLHIWTSGPTLKDDQVRGFEKLKNLESLVIVGCESLVRVDVSQLTHLEWLDFCGCCNLLEIKGLERLKNLTELNLVGCPSIDTLPDLSCFHNLEFVFVDNRSNIPDVRGVRRAKYLGNGRYSR
ncbi:hypothetical protein ACJRO7_018862 [Eucalyptus globulus]|uniref:TIR domain-containing protein n=1 Tax=Eucalyptus globulus TaxID=34317 RepID=A0ABD3L1D3_EUCGL